MRLKITAKAQHFTTSVKITTCARNTELKYCQISCSIKKAKPKKRAGNSDTKPSHLSKQGK